MIPAATRQRRDEEYLRATNRHEVDQLLERWRAEDRALAESKTVQAQQLDELARRVAQLESLLGPRGRKLLDLIAEGVGEVLSRERSKTKKMVADEIERRPLVSDQGVWAAAREYKAGDLVSHRGSA